MPIVPSTSPVENCLGCGQSGGCCQAREQKRAEKLISLTLSGAVVALVLASIFLQ